MRDIDYIVLHYSATYDDEDYGVEDIRAMHMRRGFNDIGYHWVIKLDGTVQKGRDEALTGAHVKGHNHNTIGICLIGGLKRSSGIGLGVDTRTPEQKEAAIKLIDRLLKKYPKARIVGHKDLGPTQCPAYDAAKWWTEVQLGRSVRGSTVPTKTPAIPEWLKRFYDAVRGGSTRV